MSYELIDIESTPETIVIESKDDRLMQLCKDDKKTWSVIMLELSEMMETFDSNLLSKLYLNRTKIIERLTYYREIEHSKLISFSKKEKDKLIDLKQNSQEKYTVKEVTTIINATFSNERKILLKLENILDFFEKHLTGIDSMLYNYKLRFELYERYGK